MHNSYMQRYGLGAWEPFIQGVESHHSNLSKAMTLRSLPGPRKIRKAVVQVYCNYLPTSHEVMGNMNENEVLNF
jgi:hypothetical protein